MENGKRMSVAEMRRVLAEQAAQLSKLQANIEQAEHDSLENLKALVETALDDVTAGVYQIAISEDGTVQVTRSKARAVVSANPASTTHDADPYWTPGLSKGPQATEARRLFYAEGMEPAAIARAISTSPGAVNRALGVGPGAMAEARTRRDELNA